MKKLLKVILPPLMGFLIFAIVIKYGSFAYHIKGLAEIGDESVYGLMAYYKMFANLLLLVAILTQLLIVMPLWRKVLKRPASITAIYISLCLICCILAGGLSYVIWDTATGKHHLLIIFLFMSAVQVFYWLINFLLLSLIDIMAIRASLKQQRELSNQNTDNNI